MKLINNFSIPLFTLFGVILFLPSLIFVLLQQPSYASGIVLSTLIIILISFFYQFSTKRSTLKYLVKYLFVIGVVLFLHSIIVLSFFHVFDFTRFIGSIFILFIMTLGVFTFVEFLIKTPDDTFSVSLMPILGILFLVSLFGAILHYSPFPQYSKLNKPIFPYMEPSHFSLIIAPYFIWTTLTRKNMRSKILLIIYGLIVLFFTSNLTLAFVILVSSALAFGLKKLSLFIPLLALLIIASNYDLNYYSKRIDLQNENLSTLVWLQGWEEAYLNFKDSKGLGVGFQQFGVEDPKGDAANTILMLTKNYMNRYDGSTFSSKLIGEFGILGLLIIAFFTWLVFKSYLFLKNTSKNVSSKLIFFHSCIVYFVIELYIRSMSYISPGFFIFMVGCLGVYLTNDQKNGKPFLKNLKR